jgi:hypothetical protein
MAAIGNLTLTDATPVTPVNRTFYPQPDIMSNVNRWVDRAGGIALGYPTATLSLRMPTKQSRVFKVMAKLVVPTLEVTSPTTTTGIQPGPTLSYNHIASSEYIIPERGSLQERKDLNAMYKDFLGDAVVTAAVENFEPTW